MAVTFKVVIERTVIHKHTVEVEASSYRAARAKALEQADDLGDANADSSFGDWKVKQVEEVLPAGLLKPAETGQKQA